MVLGLGVASQAWAAGKVTVSYDVKDSVDREIVTVHFSSPPTFKVDAESFPTRLAVIIDEGVLASGVKDVLKRTGKIIKEIKVVSVTRPGNALRLVLYINIRPPLNKDDFYSEMKSDTDLEVGVYKSVLAKAKMSPVEAEKAAAGKKGEETKPPPEISKPPEKPPTPPEVTMAPKEAAAPSAKANFTVRKVEFKSGDASETFEITLSSTDSIFYSVVKNYYPTRIVATLRNTAPSADLASKTGDQPVKGKNVDHYRVRTFDDHRGPSVEYVIYLKEDSSFQYYVEGGKLI
ncbi:MAG: hypothetical protein ACREDU_11740, partial [Methylocella sp.]